MKQQGNKTIYVRDHEMWSRAMQMAEEQGLSMSEFINVALQKMLKPDDENTVILNKIRALVCQ